MRQASKLAGMTAVLLGSMATAALAVPAETAGASVLRSGPGVGYPVVAALPAHTVFDLGKCSGNWCPARWRGLAGYISLASLTIAAPVVDPYADRWDTDSDVEDRVLVRRKGHWVWVPRDNRGPREDRNRNRNRNQDGNRKADDDRRGNTVTLRGHGGGAIWLPAGGTQGNRSSDDRNSSSARGGSGGGRDGGGRGGDGGGRGGDGGGRGGDGGGGGGGNGGGGGGCGGGGRGR